MPKRRDRSRCYRFLRELHDRAYYILNQQIRIYFREISYLLTYALDAFDLLSVFIKDRRTDPRRTNINAHH